MPEYLRLMGSHHQNAGRLAVAREHLQAGLAASPDSTDMQTALLWLLIDSNDAVALRELLARHEVAWSRQAAVHNALASSYQALSQPQVALERYLTPQLQARQDDFLWMMNYADALDQNQQFDRAWHLRRHLLRQQWRQLAQQVPNAQGRPELVRAQWLTQQGLDATQRVARARLQITQNPGDPAYAVLRELMRLDLDDQGQLSNAAAETAIGWLRTSRNTQQSGVFCGTSTPAAAACAPTARSGPTSLSPWPKTTAWPQANCSKPLTNGCHATTV
jgi:hypothetical protein